jgi:hypothetical protein
VRFVVVVKYICKILTTALLSFSFSGCALVYDKPTLQKIHSKICPPTEGFFDDSHRAISTKNILTNEIVINYEGKDYSTCIYQEVKAKYNDTLSNYPYYIGTYKKYSFDGKMFSYPPEQQIRLKNYEEKIAFKESEEKTKEAECLSSPECLNERRKEEKKQQIKNQKTNSICESFFDDLSSKINFNRIAIVVANHSYDTPNGAVYTCIAQGFVTTPNGQVFKQIVLTGNSKTGAYEYR